MPHTETTDTNLHVMADLPPCLSVHQVGEMTSSSSSGESRPRPACSWHGRACRWMDAWVGGTLVGHERPVISNGPPSGAGNGSMARSVSDGPLRPVREHVVYRSPPPPASRAWVIVWALTHVNRGPEHFACGGASCCCQRFPDCQVWPRQDEDGIGCQGISEVCRLRLQCSTG